MNENFEQVKEAASNAFKDGVEKVTANFHEATASGQANIDAFVAASQIVGKGMSEIAAIATQYSKTAFEDGVQTAKGLGSAKSLQEAMELQAEFVKSSISNWMQDFNKINEILVSTGKEAAKPVTDRTNEVFNKAKNAE